MNTTIEDVILNYLKRNVPIKKIRNGRRFKRGFTLNYENHFISKKNDAKSKTEINIAFSVLTDEIKYVFNSSDQTTNIVALKYLNIL